MGVKLSDSLLTNPGVRNYRTGLFKIARFAGEHAKPGEAAKQLF